MHAIRLRLSTKLLAKVVDALDGVPMADRDTKGDSMNICWAIWPVLVRMGSFGHRAILFS